MSTTEAERNELTGTIAGMLRQHDSFKAIEHLLSPGDTDKIPAAFSGVSAGLYRLKDVSGMVAIGRAGVQYCLTRARELGASEPDRARKLRVSAQIMSYNLAANAWPGWNDEGIVISRDQLAFGLDMARLDLRLAIEMEYPPLKLSNAHWIIGAHELAARDFGSALKTFEAALKYAEAAASSNQALMVKGYIALTQLLAGGPLGAHAFAGSLAALRSAGNDDCQFFAQQLETARKVFEQK